MSNTGKKTLVSLGMSCQTAHQLRRLTDHEIQPGDAPPAATVHSGIFDWLICPPKSITNLLNDGIPDFSKKSIHLHKGRPYWEDYDLYFWHNFTVTKNQNRQISIEETFEKELTRWSHLRARFSDLVPAETVFVVSNTQNNLATEVFDTPESDKYQLTSTMIKALENSLANHFDTSADSIHLEVVTRENRSSGLRDNSRVTFLPIDQHEWKGSKQSWNLWWQKLKHNAL